MDTVERVLEDYQRSARGDAAAAQLLRLQGLPAPRDEHWQHANLRALNRVTRFLAADSVAPIAPNLPASLIDGPRLVWVDGHFSPALSTAGAAALLDTQPADAASAAPDRPPADADLRFAMLATLFGERPARVNLSGACALELVHVCTGAPGSVYPRLHLKLADHAQVTLLERLVGSTAGDSLLCTDLRIALAPNAQLTHYRLHENGAGTQLIDNLSASVGAEASYRAHHLAVAAGNARSSYSIALDGAGADCSWSGVGIVRDGESFDSLVRIEHRAAGTRAVQRFRGIASGHSRLGCSSDVQVGAAARGARVSQSLRGLIDGPGATINLRPRLTIDTDDIQASHGATTGQLDDNLLFYLLSRGIDRETARSLLKWAFLGDLLAGIELPGVRHAAERLAAAHLADVLGIDPGSLTA